MTTIAALEGIDYAVLVADSQITEGTKMAVLIISLLLTVTSFVLLVISLFSKQITERMALVVGVSLLLATLLQLSNLIWN